MLFDSILPTVELLAKLESILANPFFSKLCLNFCGIAHSSILILSNPLTLCSLSMLSLSHIFEFLSFQYPEEVIIGSIFCPLVFSKSYKLRQKRNLLKNIWVVHSFRAGEAEMSYMEKGLSRSQVPTQRRVWNGYHHGHLDTREVSAVNYLFNLSCIFETLL